jgi:hypothetical protein
MKIECPSHFERNKFIETFCEIIQMLIGIGFEFSKSNYREALWIFRELKNNYFTQKALEFFSTFSIEDPFEKVLDFQSLQIEIPSKLIENIASNFYSHSENDIQKFNPSILSQILNSLSLKIKNEDSHFEVLCNYLNKHPDSFSIFEFIQFSSLSLNCLKRFFEIFPPSKISMNLWNSLSTLATKSDNKSRYIEQIIETKLFEFETKGTEGVFSYFRKQLNNQNPQNSHFLKIKANAVRGNNDESKLLELNTSTYFYGGDNRTDIYIDFDFQNNSFQLSDINFLPMFHDEGSIATKRNTAPFDRNSSLIRCIC